MDQSNKAGEPAKTEKFVQGGETKERTSSQTYETEKTVTGTCSQGKTMQGHTLL